MKVHLRFIPFHSVLLRMNMLPRALISRKQLRVFCICSMWSVTKLVNFFPRLQCHVSLLCFFSFSLVFSPHSALFDAALVNFFPAYFACFLCRVELLLICLLVRLLGYYVKSYLDVMEVVPLHPIHLFVSYRSLNLSLFLYKAAVKHSAGHQTNVNSKSTT